MTTLTAADRPAVRASEEVRMPRREPMSLSRRLLTVVLIGVLVLSAWSIHDLGIRPMLFVESWENGADFLRRTVPFTFPPLPELWEMIGQTLALVVLATLLGFVISLPMALLAARNTTINAPVRHVARFLIVLERAVPDFIVAMFFVRALGLGTLPGILALGLGSLGMMAKLYADAIEDIDPGPVEALRASGAGRLQQIVGGVIPQLKPQLIATAMHAFDVNLRGSVILGFVGVTGIGMFISAALETMNYARGLGLTLVLLALCLVAELISGLVRRHTLTGGSRAGGRSRWLEALRFQPTERGWIRGGHQNAPVPTRAADEPASDGSADPAQATETEDSQTAPCPSARRSVTPPWTAERVRSTLWTALFVLLIAVSFVFSGVELRAMSGGLHQAVSTLALYFPPDAGGIPEKLLATMWETIQMGLAGTLIGLVIAIPFGLASAQNVSRSRTVSAIARACVVSIRAIPGIIVGIALVVITGLGAVAGTFALAVAAIGFFSKVIADSLEEVDVQVQDAVRSSGATGVQVFFGATLRQVAPALMAHTMHQLDRNIRGATGLGVIGAGGIGFYLNNAQRVLEFGVVTTCLLLIVATVLLSEALAMWTRREVT